MSNDQNSVPGGASPAGKKRGRKPKYDLTSRQRSRLIQWIAEGLDAREIRNLAKNYSTPFGVTQSTLAYYRKHMGIKIKEVRAEKDLEAIHAGLALRANRLQALKDLARMLEDDLRHKDKLWIQRVKGIGSGHYYERVVEEEFNESELRQLRGLYEDIAKEVGARTDAYEQVSGDTKVESPLVIPADMLAPAFFEVYRDAKDKQHMEYVLKGGRGSTKSSFTSLMMIYLLVHNPTIHGVALRQQANTLRDSVYTQLVWAIGVLGQTDKFKCTTSPLEITYHTTGQKIYFRGSDKPEMIKSIKPVFGHIGLLWFEELDQFAGQEAIRKIEQSVLRGGEEAWEFKTYNPPITAANWVNKYVLDKKKSQMQHHSDYLTVPKEWLGKTFLDEAEHLKKINPRAYNHEYMGEVTGTGGNIFENIELRDITDEELSQFDRITCGQDWGFFPDPAHWVKVHYDAARLTLYLIDELRAWKTGNKDLYNRLVDEKGLTPDDLIIADSAEPKSVADFREYGATCRGAEKGPESVKYSIKWLQSLKAIVIDNRRTPYAAEEFTSYEYELDKDNNFISQYPDKNNHGIDATRYATNLIWRRRGQ